MKLISVILVYFMICLGAEITVTQSANEYALKYSDSTMFRILSFRKNEADNIFRSLHYSLGYKSEALAHEILYIDTLWRIAESNIEIDLTSADIGYPMEFPDVIRNYIDTFNRSKKWQAHVKAKKKELNYPLMHEIIYEADIYRPFSRLLEKYGYRVASVSSEKHGFILKSDLRKFGFKGNEIIPMPFMLYWKLEKIKF
jgi:hypothetical protein